MSNPNVMNPIPQKVFTKIESDTKLNDLILLEESSNDKTMQGVSQPYHIIIYNLKLK